jgi:hypothetical protein
VHNAHFVMAITARRRALRQNHVRQAMVDRSK